MLWYPERRGKRQGGVESRRIGAQALARFGVREGNFVSFNWIYWGDFGSQNHTGFRCITQNIICMLHRVAITQAKSLFIPIPSICSPLSIPTYFPGGLLLNLSSVTLFLSLSFINIRWGGWEDLIYYKCWVLWRFWRVCHAYFSDNILMIYIVV